MSGRVLLPLLVGAVLAAGGVTGREAAAEPASCPAGTVRAVIGGKRVCLRAGQPCRRSLDRQYRRYGFRCTGTRLARATPPPTGADLMVAVEPPQPRSPGPVTFTVRVANLGPQAAGDVTLGLSVAGGAVTGRALAGPGSCSADGSRVHCRLGSLAAAARTTVILAVRPSGPGELDLAASVAGATPDPRPANNALTVATSVPAGDLVRAEGLRSAYYGGSWWFAIDTWSGPAGEEPGGHFLVRSEQDGVVRHAAGQVVCLTVTGNRAAVGARVDETNDGAFFGRYVTFLVTDHAAGPDTSITLVQRDEPVCALEQLPELPLLEGDVAVVDAP